MKLSKQDKEHVLAFLMQSSSLHDLLEILSNICKNLDLNYLNPRIKHFRYFQFTFFGLIVKAKGLLDMMLFKSEFLEKNLTDFKEIYVKLQNLKKGMEKAYNLINKKKMDEGKKEIIKIDNEYFKIFQIINEIANRMI